MREGRATRNVEWRKRLEREIVEIADRERQRLGRELHDGLCQTLAGIAALSSTLSKRLAAESERHASSAAEITQMLNAAIGEARDLARGLAPRRLKDTDLEGALATLALEVQQQHQVHCALLCDGSIFRMQPEVEAQLFRIVQEAVTNSLTHGRAGRIEISLSANDGKACLSITDDGAGLPDKAHKSKGMGLGTMVYRSRLVGGSLDVRRRPRRGTVVTCTFPVAEAPHGVSVQ